MFLQIGLHDGVEIWLNKLRDSVCATLRELLLQALRDVNTGVPVEDWPIKVTSKCINYVFEKSIIEKFHARTGSQNYVLLNNVQSFFSLTPLKGKSN